MKTPPRPFGWLLQIDAPPRQFGQSIAKLVASYDFTPMLKKFSEAMIPIKYIDLLERLKWPVFLIDDEDLRNKILLACNKQDDAAAVREIIFDYCSNEFLEAMEQDWNACPAVKEMRKPILLEAMQLQKSGFYYKNRFSFFYNTLDKNS